ncbi:MFS general substrate transporter [Trichoderma citrinoviride]|uniref:MFS general substrate transporter n=1 Tax=Trichoderma citrinoviride TaxID=58853 RepID=A0A2T4BL28_9HYPO|nr:MFS general substrate transporter [Trichoderma citrinoviride]PTB69970.1 MFS general substrate transporter [Trichoderma citrinoviride]
MAKSPEQTALLAGHESPSGDSSPPPGRSSGAGTSHGGRGGALGDPSSSRPAEGPKHKVGFARGIAVGASLFILIFLHSTNMSGLTMIQGPLASSLHAPSRAQSLTTSYLIAMSSLLPPVGRLAAVLSPRAVVLPSTACFALGSLAASQATSYAAFLAARIIMGVGGAGIVVMAVVFVIELTGPRERGVVIGSVNAAFTMGVSVGAAVYGVLEPVVGWRPLFWFPSPIALLAGVGLYISLPASMSLPPAEQSGKPAPLRQRLASIDYLGAFLLTLTIVLFLYSLSTEIHPLPLLTSLLTLSLFTLVEFRLATDPIIPLSVLSSRPVLLSCLAQLGLMTARWAILFYTPILMLSLRASSPGEAGSLLIATNIGFSIGGLAIGWLHIRRQGSYYLAQLLSLLAFTLTVLGLSVLTHHVSLSSSSSPAPSSSSSSFTAFVITVCLNGIITGISLNYALVHILHLSHPSTSYITTSLLATFRGFGGSFGTSLGGGIFFRVLRARLVSGFLSLDDDLDDGPLSPERRKLIEELLGSPQLVWKEGFLSRAREREVAVRGYADAIGSVWRAAACLGVVVIVVQAAAGWAAPEEEGERTLQEEEEEEEG